MLSSRIPSVKDTYFQHKQLTKVHGQPSYESLHKLSTELKANAASVPSSHGGGLYGHLGLIVSRSKYAALPLSIPWTTPISLGAFKAPITTTGKAPTAAQIDAAKDEWKEHKATFELYQATEKALIAQVVEAIDPIYLRALLNRTTGQYANNIRDVIKHLFTTYGKITPQQVKTAELNVYNMQYDISQPVDVVFNAIDDLSELAEHASSPMSPQQLIDLAYIIFANQPVLQQDLRLWSRKPLADRTWSNMLTHFRDAQTDLTAIPIASDLYPRNPLHNANAVTAMADLVAQRLLDSMPPNDEPSLLVPQPDTINTALQQREASLAARETALSNQVQELMALMLTGSVAATPTNDNSRNPRGGRGRGRNHTRNTSSTSTRTAPSPRQYCWSHGACAHSSADCNTRQPGHQTTATFDNMMAGSTTNCFWLNT